MSNDYHVEKVEITVIQHATESSEKIQQLIKKLFPKDFVSKPIFEKRVFKGHHGNPITFYRVIVTGNEATNVLNHIMEKMEFTSKRLLSATIMDRIKGSIELHIRLSKQHLVDNRIIVWDGDEILKIMVKFKKPQHLKKFIETLEK